MAAGFFNNSYKTSHKEKSSVQNLSKILEQFCNHHLLYFHNIYEDSEYHLPAYRIILRTLEEFCYHLFIFSQEFSYDSEYHLLFSMLLSKNVWRILQSSTFFPQAYLNNAENMCYIWYKIKFLRIPNIIHCLV